MPDNAVEQPAATGPSLPDQAFSAFVGAVRLPWAGASGAVRPSAMNPVPGR